MTLGPVTQINAARRAGEEHKLSCSWDHVQVSFKITTRKSREQLKAIFNDAQTRLPDGWHYHKIYFAADDMPVERIDFVIIGMLRFADGAAVRAFLNMIQ
jgi:hypothetical protein